ncbi:hypothetical protein [Agathobaculum desmolans]|uniref:hypothetical protein n=1 Tax=Agathobaculum desmolans TaxID=39484 RepID=UPI0012B5C65B|nr:hypothetical protein [Agathobaculum desmolans]
MKMKNNFWKCVGSVALCGMFCVVFAYAVSDYSPWTSTVTGMNNIKYHGRTGITASNGMVSSTATILTTDSTKVPAKYVKAYAELYRGIALASYGGPVENGALSTGITATTGKASGQGTYTAHGTTWYKGSDGAMKTLELESVDYYMAVRANGGVDLTTEEKQIHTNADGGTYGEAMVVKYLNEDVDMISAIGKNGTEGYIKTSDLPHNIPDYVPHDHDIPVYASDGVTVIDSFFISSGYTDTVE